MKTRKASFLFLGALVTQFFSWSAFAATQLQGAGATFPAPLFQRWIAEYTKTNPDVQIYSVTEGDRRQQYGRA
jgi:ABC-type phosphate transport system substrate-binding protein